MLMDKEKSWRRNLSTLQSLMEPTVSLDFAQCDVTEGAGTHANSKAMEVLTANSRYCGPCVALSLISIACGVQTIS
jgi:hypothetical protein